jgi:hypothetical protein
MILYFVIFLLFTQVNAFYLKAGPNHNTIHTEFISDPIDGPYHIILSDVNKVPICSISADGFNITKTDLVCNEASIESSGLYWIFSIHHKEHPHGTITAKILMPDGTLTSELIKGICPDTGLEGNCINTRPGHTLHSPTPENSILVTWSLAGVVMNSVLYIIFYW